jgi:hypothetical protein
MDTKGSKIMPSKPWPEDSNELIDLAEQVADVLAGKLAGLGLSREPEASLRASIAAARYALLAYVAMLDGLKDSPVAQRFLGPARNRRDRSQEQLRCRLAAIITAICLLIENDELSDVARYVVARTL